MKDDTIVSRIDLGAVSKNIQALRRITRPDAVLMAVVKADGYGHGAVQTAKTALKSGAKWLGVARAAEGMALREAGIAAPILVFGATPLEMVPKLAVYQLRQAVSSLDIAQRYATAARNQGGKLRVHLKIDTGMGRLGWLPHDPEAVRDIKMVMSMAGLHVEGIYTHFASADESDKTSAKGQLSTFIRFLDKLKKDGITFPIRHAANSAGVIDLPESHLDMVRPGISIYGYYPSDKINKKRLKLTPAMTFSATIIHEKRVPAGFPVSYGHTHVTSRPTVLATVNVGYADGLHRGLSGKGEMLVHCERASIVGRICMDLTMLDVGHIPDIRIGDDVVIFGRQDDAFLGADETAAHIGSISYEMLTSVGKRVPREYVG